ncbi:serine acetyltransferase, partial [Bifidobacterium biavatii]|uniref:serine acetyltransferase n=2 Tax=Bifidobacterium biavatii TaxID=762212 RepID=UPI001362F7C7
MKRLLRIYEYRLNNAHKSVFHRIASFVAKIRYRRVSRSLCSEISPNVFGKGLQIWHGTRIIVNGHATVGENCSISSGVIIGQAHNKFPSIGDNVQLNINTTVLGGITISNNTVIGANALVVKDI